MVLKKYESLFLFRMLQTTSDIVNHGLKHTDYTLRKEIRMKWAFLLNHKPLKSNLR